MSTINLTLSGREAEVLHKLLSHGFTVAGFILDLDEIIESDKQPDAGQAALDRLALMRVLTVVKQAATQAVQQDPRP